MLVPRGTARGGVSGCDQEGIASRTAGSSGTCGVPELGRWFDLGVYAAGSHSLMRPPRTARRLIRSWVGPAAGGRPGWAELAAAVGSSSVVVGLVLGKDAAQVAFAEDEHPIGDLGPGGEHEPFRISVRARTPGRNSYGFDAGAGQDRVKGRGELPGTVAYEELEVRSVVAEVHQQIADLLGRSAARPGAR